MSPEEYKALYEKHGLKPCRGDLLVVTKGGLAACAAGARLVEACGGVDQSEGYIGATPNHEAVARRLGVSSDFLLGLVCGFDSDAKCADSDDARLGNEEGRAVAALMFPGEEECHFSF